MPNIQLNKEPTDIFAASNIAPGTTVQLQNMSSTAIRIYSGATMPGTVDDYNEIEPKGWHVFQGQVLSGYVSTSRSVNASATIVVNAE